MPMREFLFSGYLGKKEEAWKEVFGSDIEQVGIGGYIFIFSDAYNINNNHNYPSRERFSQ